MEVKFTKEQEELFLKNYEMVCKKFAELPFLVNAMSKDFLFGCIGNMLSNGVADRIFAELMVDTRMAISERNFND